MSRILVLYASTHGHTGKIAARIAEAIGPGAEVHDIKSRDAVEPSPYDAVVIGASVHAGHHQKAILDWIGAHTARLNRMPTAFFSVCLTAAEDDEELRRESQQYIDRALERTGWEPAVTQTFAGALQYREYDVFTRLLIKLMMKHGGHPTDTSRDYDYTDWDAVERFGAECAGLVPVAAP